MLFGSGGGLFLAVAVMISTYGWLSGDILTTPRVMYSFAANGDAPAILARLHPRYSTPGLALVVYSTLAWGLAVSGTFLWVAALGAASALIFYSGVCASLIRLRKLRPEARALRIPFGPAIAVAAMGISLALISALNLHQAMLIAVTALVQQPTGGGRSDRQELRKPPRWRSPFLTNAHNHDVFVGLQPEPLCDGS